MRKAEGEALLWRAGTPVHTYFQQATRYHGNTGDALMSLLERMDNIVHRAGFG
jgi:ribosomal protein S4